MEGLNADAADVNDVGSFVDVENSERILCERRLVPLCC